MGDAWPIFGSCIGLIIANVILVLFIQRNGNNGLEILIFTFLRPESS